MLEVVVKASIASDPLDILPAACARDSFIAVMCETGYVKLKTKQNQTEFENQTDPVLEIVTLCSQTRAQQLLRWATVAKSGEGGCCAPFRKESWTLKR